MKRVFATMFFLGLVLGCGPLLAGAGHYTSGVEGIKAATVPPPGGSGFYGKLYNAYYSAGEMRDNQGKKSPVDFDVDVLVQGYRFIYSSDIEFLGGNLLFDILIPIMYTDISVGAFSDSKGGLGDIFVEPIFIGWHGERYDALAAIGVYVPTGRYDQGRMASPGNGFWTYLFTLGGTVYLDQERTWSLSALARYQVHTKQDDTDITSGDHFSFEWGLGKNINGLDLGLAGYCHWQVEDDKGPNGTIANNREKAFAVGPEIAYTFESIGLSLNLRSLWEFENKNKSQGNITVLNLTYGF